MKAFFLSRLFREKVLLLAFVLLTVATWFSSVLGRVNRFSRDFSVTTSLLTTQRGWLNQQSQIEAAAKAAVEHLDPAKTYDSIRLPSEISAIAARTGVSVSADSMQPERTSQFTMNSMQVRIQNADYPSLVKFYLELVKQTPYIGIEQFTLRVANNRHSALLRVTSVEMAK